MNRVRGISIAVIVLLGVGAVGGAVALGVSTSTPSASDASPTVALSARRSPSTTTSAPVTPSAAPMPASVPVPVAAAEPVIDPGPALEPDPVEAPQDTFLGYDARQLWDECSAQGMQDFPGSEVVGDYDLRRFYDGPDGRPMVFVPWGKPDEPDLVHVLWVCTFSGDTSAPVLDVLQAKDV